MFSRRSLFGKLFGGALASTVKLDPTQALQGSVMLAEPLKLASMTLDTSAIKLAVNAAMQNMKFSLPDGSFIVVPPLTDEDDESTITCGSSTG